MEDKRKMKIKILGLFLLMFAVLLVSSTLVSAADCTNTPFSIHNVEVNGVNVVENGNPVYVERGETISVAVEFMGLEDSYNTRLKAWIGGYEYGDVQATSSIFQVIDGVEDRKVLLLTLPNDLSASDNYTLNVELYDDDEDCGYKYLLRVEEVRHELQIYDVTLNPGTTVHAGEPLFVSVRVENLGDNIEESIKVTARMPTLGLQDSEYVNQLVSEEDNGDCDDDCKMSASANDLVLLVPTDTLSGQYQLDVVVEYNRGHDLVTTSKVINIVAGTQFVPETPTVTLSVDSASKSANVGEGVIYKVDLMNLGNLEETFTFAVEGVQGWGIYSADPASLTLGADQKGTVNLFVSPVDNAANGLKAFTLKVMADGSTVKELSLNMNVGGSQSNGSDGQAYATNVLLIIFIVLVCILVLLGIAVAIKKFAGSKGSDSEEGQSYY